MTIDHYLSLYEATTVEAHDVLDKIAENGRTTLKPGSPALAIFYAYDELFLGILTEMIHMRERVEKAIE